MDSYYDFSLTTFSPSGKLVQIEYALHAVASGSTALGIKGLSPLHYYTHHNLCQPFLYLWLCVIKRIYAAKNGVVIATEKKLPTLMDVSSVQKTNLLTANVGMVYAGMGPDSRVLLRTGRKKAEAYFRVYKDPIPVSGVVKELASVMQEFTQSGYVHWLYICTCLLL